MGSRRKGPGADVVPSTDLGKLRDVRPRDYLIRFALGAVISVSAAIIAQAVGARFSGVFLAFPAILPASLTLIQEKEGTRDAARNAIGAVLGGLGVVVFAAVAQAGLVHLPSAVALVLALAAWVIVSSGMYSVLAAIRPETCDKKRDVQSPAGGSRPAGQVQGTPGGVRDLRDASRSDR